MSKLIYYVDDNAIPTVVRTDLAAILPADTEVCYLANSDDLISSLETAQVLPWIVFYDSNTLGPAGIELLNWVRRHPKFHHIPIVMISPDRDQETQNSAKALGVLGLLSKPVSVDALWKIIQDRQDAAVDPQELYSLDQDFAGQAIHKLLELSEWGSCFDKAALSKTAMVIHTIKGEARVLEFPTLASFCHTFEGVLNQMKKRELAANPQLGALLNSVFRYLKLQCERIRAGKLLEDPPTQLVTEIAFFIKVLEMGWHPGTDSNDVVSFSQGPVPASVGNRAEAFEVSFERFDRLQSYLRSLLRDTVQANLLAHDIQKVEKQNPALSELADLIETLNNGELKIFELLVQIFTVPGEKIRAFCEQSILEMSRSLGKPVRAQVEIEAGMELDQVLFDVLLFIVTHMVRNAVDHGIENSDDRQKNRKPPEGLVRITLASMRRHRVELIVEDDGRGIDRDMVKRLAIKKSLKTVEEVTQMSDGEIDALIFLDNFSTASTITEFSGRGVGLAAVKKFVEERSGKIDVKSTLGAGTTFRVVLPRMLQLLA